MKRVTVQQLSCYSVMTEKILVVRVGCLENFDTAYREENFHLIFTIIPQRLHNIFGTKSKLIQTYFFMHICPRTKIKWIISIEAVFQDILLVNHSKNNRAERVVSKQEKIGSQEIILISINGGI